MVDDCAGCVRWLHGAGSAGEQLAWFRLLTVFLPSACRFRLVTGRALVLKGRDPGAGLVASKGRGRAAAEGVLYPDPMIMLGAG